MKLEKATPEFTPIIFKIESKQEWEDFKLMVKFAYMKSADHAKVEKYSQTIYDEIGRLENAE